MAVRAPGVVRFVEESWSELRKVTWPSGQTVVRLTVIVLVISALIGLYIFVFDRVFTEVMTKPLNEITTPPAAP
jgi:preprotein translocase SecE subunit